MRWLMAILALVALTSRPPVPDEFELSLAYGEGPRAYTLRVSAPSSGPIVWRSTRASGARNYPVRTGTLRRDAWTRWREHLEAAGLWTIPDCDRGGLLHTRLLVREGTHQHGASWVALPTRVHGELMDSFLGNGPLAGEVSGGWDFVLGGERGSNTFPGEN